MPATTGIASATRHVLPNGIVVLALRNPSTPTVSVQGDMRIGAVDEPAEKAGLASFTASALIRGTRRRNYQQIVEETEQRGCSVSSGGGAHTSSFSARALAEDLPLVLEVLADMLREPTFPQAEIEKLRGQFLMSLREAEQETRTQASRAMRKMLYPDAHPYSRSSSGTLETVQAISRDDLAAFHQGYHPATTTVAVVGDVEPQAVIAERERVFAGWEPASPPAPKELPPTTPLSGAQRKEIPMEGKAQSDLIYAVHGLRRADDDYYAAMLANLILGRIGMGGRLGDHVREDQGMAYSVGSSLDANLGAGPWYAVAGVNPANVERAVEGILNEIRQFQQDGPSDQELADARSYLIGSLALGLETNSGVAGTLVAIERFGLGLDYIDRYPELISAVSQEQIVAAARRYLSTEHYVLAVAGPKAS
jgi:zinc protease